MNQNRNNSPNHDSTGETISWVIIIVLLIAAWPIGLALLLWRGLRGKKPIDFPNRADWEGTAADAPEFRSPLEKKSGKFASAVLLLVSIVLFIAGASFFIAAIESLRISFRYVLSDLLLSAFFIVGGIVTFFSRRVVTGRIVRYKKHYAASKGRGIVLISDLARTAGVSEKAAARDLTVMITAGYFPRHVYIDIELSCLVLNAEEAEAARDVIRAGFRPEDEVNENQYMAILNELRELHGAIADFAISEKVTEIEDLAAKIFRIVEEEPSKLPQIRRFMSYYLPTTLKLLRSYATLEKQGIKGENITAAKENIGRILDTLVQGYEKQLDQLFKSDMIDLGADISVLENMMQQDGLAK
ncbi:MAG: 5-bromo-4-chloroindolyl phosphate hydrolysis family protein [Oscillospiraceae bacterium]|nr:5-bromo-4-chloroindolyl phosphate hydrolysis family protein [Oscillospiraceae bacterium]